MTTNVFIDGGHGTTGIEIAERLAGRQELSLITLDLEDRRATPRLPPTPGASQLM